MVSSHRFYPFPKNDTLLAFRVCIIDEDQTQEAAISNHLRSIDAKHPGKIRGLHGLHQCLVFPALGTSLTSLRDLLKERAIDKTLLPKFLLVIETTLDFMHQAGVVHTGKSQILRVAMG
jgi:hypothetical protein